MQRFLSVLIITLLAPFALLAQATPETTVSGFVRSASGSPVDACILTILLPSDSSIVAYSMTGSDGGYSISFKSKEKNLLLRNSGFNMKTQFLEIENKSQTVDIVAIEEDLVLNEVLIKADRLWGSRDTLNYLVSSYIKDHDRTIGDVLTQLPGITIEPGGTIKYQGIPINHFYIENLDALNGRYNIATQGIRAEDVSTVQVYENHQHIKALQDQVQPESAAINLKLKEKVKGIWSKNIKLGVGYDDDVLWNTTLGLMNFGRKAQHIIYLSSSNDGNGVDYSNNFYNFIGLGQNVITGILEPSSSPVGKSSFGNLHTLNINNLSKLSETAQLSYNISFKHDIERKSSFAQTTYILPDAGITILSEDLSARNTTNKADVELGYENNNEKRYVENWLNVVGEWLEANGAVLSNESNIRQHNYNRNLGISNRLRFVHRTADNNGFELKSTSLIQTNPQALNITEDMAARQEIDLFRISTKNELSMLKNLRRHRWTIAPMAGVNLEYIAGKFLLSPPETKMDYLNAYARLGVALKFVKNDFRFNLNLPVSLAYTNVNNTNSPQVETDASATRLRFSPDASLIWKAAERWTVTGSANYGMSQTPWTRLITSFIMSDYRTTSRYSADLADSFRAQEKLKLSYKNIMNEVFAWIESSVSRNWSDVIYGTFIDENARTIIQAENRPNHNDRFSVLTEITKGLDWHKMNIGLNGSFSRDKRQVIRQEIPTDFQTSAYTLGGRFSIEILRISSLNYHLNWSKSVSSSTLSAPTDYSYSFSSISQSAELNTKITSQISLNIKGNHVHNSRYQGKKDYAFMNAKLSFRTKSRQEFSLTAENIFNTRTFVSRSSSDLAEFQTIHHLRPRAIFFSTQIFLGKKMN